MNSSIISVSEILNSAQSLVSAGFSVGYNFDEINAGEYFDQLIESAAVSNPIFSGILILQKSENNFTIIDGLQRITTINLLLCALCESYGNISKKNEEARNKIFNRYLIFDNEPKLKLINEEQLIYKKILFSEKLDENESESNLNRTYKEFLKKMRERKILGTELFRIISRMQFMIIITEKAEVSTRELYQALNGNKDKSQLNLISDFIIQKDESTEIIWRKITNLYKDEENCLLEEFIRDFLTIQNDGKIPEKNSLYNNFKSYFGKISRYKFPEEIIENIFKYSGYYLNIVNSDFKNPEVKEQIEKLNKNNGKDAYPYLMEVLDDLENSHINTEVFLDILIMINSFIESRQKDSLSNVTIDFASLSKEINKMLVLKDYTPKIIDENKITLNEINNLTTFEV